jgi:hypothetical protein
MLLEAILITAGESRVICNNIGLVDPILVIQVRLTVPESGHSFSPHFLPMPASLRETF